MIRIENIQFSLEQLANAPEVQLLSVNSYKLYVNGLVTDQIGGQAYECLMPKANYEKIVVKIPDLSPVITNDKITDHIMVKFDAFVAKFWKDKSGNYQLSCKASKAILTEKAGK
jgi:hypothetical protein